MSTELSTPLLDSPPLDSDNEGIQTSTIRASQQTDDLLATRIRKRRWVRCYQKIVLALSLPPLYFLAVEMTKEHCHFCHQAIDENNNYYIIAAAALWGSLMASLCEGCGYWQHSWCASIFGGALAASGSLFTMWMLLKSIAANDVVFVFALLVGILGSMPGILVYFVAKILCLEWSKPTIAPETPRSDTTPHHSKSPRERFMSDGTVPEHVEEEEIV